jgi:hypothetical protein
METPLQNRIGCGFSDGARGPRTAAATGWRRKIETRAGKSQTERPVRAARTGCALARGLPIGGLALAALVVSGCSLAPAPPPQLDYRVERVDGGVRVALIVTAGPRPTAWIGFGASPLGGELASRGIDQVSARTLAGTPLAVQPAGVDAYRVEVTTDEPWVLEYRARVGAPPADFYHRASSASTDHLLLIGIDVWARLFDDPATLQAAPAERELGEVAAATVRFHGDSLPRGWVVATPAHETAPLQFTLTVHPARSAFALGPYRIQDVDAELGLRAALHDGWRVARDDVVSYAQRLARVQAREFGPPPGDPALLIFTPMPPSIRPSQGVRSAGMVWDRSLLLFAGADPMLPLDHQRVHEMVAIFLGHELFHLYVPWGLAITQPLSWLSEGWAEHVGRSSAQQALLLGNAAADSSLRDAYERYLEMGGARAGTLQNAAEYGGEQLRPLLYVRGELVFRVLSLEWQASGKPGSFDGELWRRLQLEYDGEAALEPEAVSRVLSAIVSPSTVRRLVEGAQVITLPELGLGRR